MNKPNRILDWLRLYGLDDILKWHRLGTGIGWAITAFGLIFAALFVVVIVQTFLVLFSGKLGDTPLRGLSFLLAFFVGAPFVIWRSVVAQRQVDTAAAALFNDKVNAATAELAARKEVTRVVGKRDKERVLTTWKDDLVRRAAAIDRLEGLAKEEPDEARRIARLLCVYVKELSRQEKPVPCTVELKDIDWTDAAVQRKTLSDLQDWSRKLVLDRTDMERAVHSLAALNTQIQAAEADKHAPPVIDLEGANLQAMRLSGLNLTNANMTGTAMQGAVLIGAEMQGAVLSWAQMQGAVLFEAEMQGADLREAEMQGAVLSWAQMQGADLREAEMQGADLSLATFDADTDFTAANPSAAAVKYLNVVQGVFDQDQITNMFGDAGTELPDDLTRPAHWPGVDLDYFTFKTEWNAFKAGPGTYDWSQRKDRYTKGLHYR